MSHFAVAAPIPADAAYTQSALSRGCPQRERIPPATPPARTLVLMLCPRSKAARHFGSCIRLLFPVRGLLPLWFGRLNINGSGDVLSRIRYEGQWVHASRSQALAWEPRSGLLPKDERSNRGPHQPTRLLACPTVRGLIHRFFRSTDRPDSCLRQRHDDRRPYFFSPPVSHPPRLTLKTRGSNARARFQARTKSSPTPWRVRFEGGGPLLDCGVSFHVDR